MHPDLLVRVLRKEKPALTEFNVKRIHGYADLLMRANSPGAQKHKKAGIKNIPEDAVFHTADYLKKKLGRDGFKHINAEAKCFRQSDTYGSGTGVTKAYWISEQGQEILQELQDAALNDEEYKLVDEEGKSVRSRKNGVYTSRDNKGKRAVTDARLRFLVPIDLDALAEVKQRGIQHYKPEISEARARRVDQQVSQLLLTGKSTQFGYGVIPQTYRESRTGRLIGQGGYSLQNVTSEARYVALNGCHEYDFSNCHFRLLEHYARTQEIETPAISEYVRDPAAYREYWAQELDISVKQAKRALISVLNGARTTSIEDASLPDILGHQKAKRLGAHPKFRELLQDARVAGRALIDSARTLRNGKIENCRGKKRKGDFKKKTAHLLQGWESDLLHLVIAHYGDLILIVQHDGFTMSEYVDPMEIKELILEQTGIDMPITYKQLGLPGL